jgi:hypothetical protein
VSLDGVYEFAINSACMVNEVPQNEVASSFIIHVRQDYILLAGIVRSRNATSFHSKTIQETVAGAERLSPLEREFCCDVETNYSITCSNLTRGEGRSLPETQEKLRVLFMNCQVASCAEA